MTKKQRDRILQVTNDVNEDTFDHWPKKDLADAVRFWSLKSSEDRGNLLSLRSQVLISAMEIYQKYELK